MAHTPSSIMLCFLVTDPKNFILVMDLSAKIHTSYNIKSMLLSTLEHRPPQFHMVGENINNVVNQMISNRFHCIISDKVLDINNPSMYTVGMLPDSNELYFDGKRFDMHSQLDGFAVHLIKCLSKLPFALKYNDTTYHFSTDNDTSTFLVTAVNDPFDFTLGCIPLRLLWNFTPENVHHAMWKQFISTKVCFTTEAASAKYTVVVNATNQPSDPSKTIYFCMEPKGEEQYGVYLQHMNANNQLMFCGTHQHHLNNAEWHLSPSISEWKRKPIEKLATFNNVLSCVVSNKAADPGHVYRLALIRKLDDMSKQGKLPFGIHIYGKCASLKFHNYKGELPNHQKDNGMFPYKYHLNVENHYADNYITEKLYDSICAECYTFYKGASNWKTFFDVKCITELSGVNSADAIANDIQLITEAIKNKAWEQGIDAIRADKHRIVTEYAFEPRVHSIIKAVKTVCYVKETDMIAYLKDQGFKQVHQEAAPFTIVKFIEASLHNNQPFLMLMSNVQYPNLFDKICFAMSKYRDEAGVTVVDAFALKDPSDGVLDLFVFPHGSEKISKNIHQYKRHIFAGLKIVAI